MLHKYRIHAVWEVVDRPRTLPVLYFDKLRCRDRSPLTFADICNHNSRARYWVQLQGNDSNWQVTLSRRLIPSTSPYAAIIGFSRAVRTGNLVCVAGTAAIGPDGATVGIGDPGAQARYCFEIIKSALEEAGASMDDVVRTRTMLTRIDDWEQVAKVRGEYLRGIRPADTVMEVSRFINPEWLVEIEVDAILDEA